MVENILCSVHTGNKKTEQVFLSLGYNPMPFSEEQVTVGVNAVIGVAGTVYIWWENAPMTKETQEAQEAQVYLEELKKRKK